MLPALELAQGFHGLFDQAFRIVALLKAFPYQSLHLSEAQGILNKVSFVVTPGTIFRM
jgi:hypothetical protein